MGVGSLLDRLTQASHMKGQEGGKGNGEKGEGARTRHGKHIKLI